MDMEWHEKVTKLARTVLVQRSYNKTTKIPSPSDIQKLTQHLQKELDSVDYNNREADTFRRVTMLAQCRILMYNKRRSGEQ